MNNQIKTWEPTKYQKLLQLNNFIENKFREKAKLITSKTSNILNKISKKIN
mgnify:CR=1 FL=1